MAANIRGGQLWLQFSQLNRRQSCLMGVGLAMDQRLGASKAGRSGLAVPRLLSAATLGLSSHLRTCLLGQVDTPVTFPSTELAMDCMVSLPKFI